MVKRTKRHGSYFHRVVLAAMVGSLSAFLAVGVPHALAIEVTPAVTGGVAGAAGAAVSSRIATGVSRSRAIRVLGDQWMRDPYIFLHSDGKYYMTCTRLGHTTGGVQGIEVWWSDNLTDWQPFGVPWTFDDSSWINSVKPRPQDTNSDFWLWAPEIHFLDDRWIAVHTTNRGLANLLVSKTASLNSGFTEPFGKNFGHRHDPSIFTDDDGSHWLVWACTKIARLKSDFSGFDGDEVRIGPSNRKLGHEGCVIRKINGKYVLFGTAWSKDKLRQGTYNLYYCTADQVTGPYGPRQFAGRFCGHGTPFQDKDGQWWTTAFLNGRLEKDLSKGQQLCDHGEAWTFNDRGMTLVPLRVETLADGNIFIRAIPEPYATPGPEEVQQFQWAAAPAEENRSRVANHHEAFQILDEKVRDPFISRGPDGFYYLTGTTAGSHWGDTVGIRLWKSPDLVAWRDLGFVWELNKDGRKQGSWHFDRPAKNGVRNGRAIWAPEIHYLNGTWWIPHSLNVGGHGLLVSTTGKPEGPYVAMPPVATHGIDAHLFQDNGKIFYLWGSDNLVRMADDLTKPVGDVRKIRPSGKHELGYEGIQLKKIGNKYLLLASGRYGYELTDTYDLYYCVAQSVEGPYNARRMAIKNAGHGNLFQDDNGRWWSTAFDHEFVESENRWTPWLVPINVIETDDDLRIEVLDERFRPTPEDQKQIAELNRTGVPAGREGKKPWDK